MTCEDVEHFSPYFLLLLDASEGEFLAIADGLISALDIDLPKWRWLHQSLTGIA